MKVWAVRICDGDYDCYNESINSLFSTEELANEFSKRFGKKEYDRVEVEEWEILTKIPVKILQYHKSDLIRLDGKIDPSFHNHNNVKFWSHEAEITDMYVGYYPHKVTDYPHNKDRYEDWRLVSHIRISVTGFDLEEVNAKHKELVKKAKAEIKGWQM